MKVYDLIQTYGKDCYVVATINSRDSEGCAEGVKIESFANEFSQAVAKREALKNQDLEVLIVPPFLTDDVSPAETADFFRAYYGWKEEKDIQMDKMLQNPRLLFFYN